MVNNVLYFLEGSCRCDADEYMAFLCRGDSLAESIGRYSGRFIVNQGIVDIKQCIFNLIK